MQTLTLILRAGVTQRRELFGMSSEEVADQAVRGMMSGRRVIVPGAANRLFVALAQLLGGRWSARMAAGINRRFRALRAD